MIKKGQRPTDKILFGKKRYGICYLPSTQYNLEEYAVKEQEMNY